MVARVVDSTAQLAWFWMVSGLRVPVRTNGSTAYEKTCMRLQMPAQPGWSKLFQGQRGQQKDPR